MNKAYKIIWSHARNCYVVVAEIARNRGKNNVKSVFSRLAPRSVAVAQLAGLVFGLTKEAGRRLPVAAVQPLTAARWIVPLMTVGILLQAVPGFASTITDASGKSLAGTGKVHDLYAQTIISNENVNFGVNRFQRFEISRGDIANMYFRLQKDPASVNSLVNLVKNRIDVQGTVNAVKNNRIGGDLYFLSPDGMAVGKTGVINAGRFVALAPSSAYFTGDIGTEGIWNSDANLAYQFRNDIANFGQRDDKGQFKELKDLAFNTDSKASINIAGRINARSGIVLGGGKIVLENGAILQSQKDLDFTSMVNAKGSNGTQLTAAAFDIGSVTLNPAADDSGDIILRATAANEYLNTPVIPAGQTYNAIFETSNSATVEVKGKIESDGGVDLSADAKTTFDNTTWNSWNISQIGQNLANDLGFNWEADWASKTNTASVTLGNTGSIKAGGDASLQADATVDVKVKAATIAKKEEGTSIAVPVIAIGVAKVKNKALIDVSGELLSEGDMSLAAAATTKANVNSKAAALTKDDADKANQIFVGVSWITGDSIAEVNIKDKKDAQGNSLKITADGDFSAEATSASDMSLTTAVVGMDETFASTGVAVLDYDSAANVNIGRSVDAKSVKAEAENEVSGLSIEASNSNGEGDDRYVGNADNIKWQLNGNTNANVIAQAIKNKFNLSGVTNDGKLKGLKDAFTKAQEYVTAGVGLAVVDTANTALVSVAPDITLKATGPATEKKDNKDVPGGDVSLSANTHMDSLHHAVSGEANKMDDDTASKVTVAAAVLYSAIENDASVELQSDTKNHKGATLESVNGSVNLRADTKQAYDPLEPFKAVPERLEKLLKTLKGLGKEFPELANLHAETVTTKKQAEDGTISEDTARKRFANYSVSFANFLSKEAQNLIALDKGVQGLIDDVSAIFSPASYTNYYVRSYMVDSHDDGGSNVAVGASLNIAKLHNKGIVSIGEKANITAGKGIKIDATTDTNVVSATGNGGEYFAFSESNGSGVGASVAVQDFSGDSLILSGKNVTMNAKGTSAEGGKIAMNAANDMNQTGIILSAGKADSKLSASGSVNVLTGDSNSLVLVDDETTATAAGDFTMSANNNSAVTNIVGGLVLGSSKTNASVGAGIAINYLGVNSMAVIGDDGTDASTTDTDTGTDDFKKKTVEEQNKIKAQNTLINARKLAEERATVKKMGTDFALSDKKLNESMGAKTAGSAKGNLSAKGVYVTGNSSGTLNAVALEGASNSENHSGFDTVNKWSKEGAAIKDQGTEAMKNIVDAPLTALDRVFDKSHISVDKAWTFSNLQTIPAPNNDPSTSSFNAAAAGSVSWNKVNSETASVIDNASLNLGKTTSGKLLNAASDDVFSGSWSGAAAVNWFTGGAGSAASPGSHKGALGTALATNNLKRDVDAVISNSTITKAGTIENTVIKNGAEAAAALGIAVTNDSQGTGTNASVAFGLSLNKSDSDIHALMIDDTVSNTNSTGTAINNRAYDGDIQVAGGVDFAFANSANGGRAIAAGITAAVSEIRNNIQSGIQGGTYTGIKDMKVAGEEALTQVNGAVAIGVTASEKGFTGTGSLAYADLDNVNHGYISGTNEISATGEVSVTDRDISGSQDNVYKEYLKQRKEDPTGESYLSSNTKSKLGTNAGSAIVNVAVGVSASKGHTAGAAITVGKVANKFSSDITNNKKLMADAVKASADVHTNIVSVGAGVSVSTKNFGGAGSLSFDDLDQDNIVSITGNRNGSADGITANTVSGTAENTSHIVNVTGDFAGGKNAAGLGIAYNRMDDTTGVYAANNRIQAKDAAKGVDVSLDAANDAYALALSMGASATYKDDGTVAAHGNFGVNRGHNDTVAVIGEDKDGNGDTATAKRNTISNASSVKAKATDKTSKTTVAGSGELAIKDTTVALGIGVALTESDKGSNAGDGRETVRAEINNADITTVKKNNAAPVISAVTTDESMAATVAVGVGITKKSLIGAQGIGADANIFKNNTAGLKDTTIDKNSGSKEALVTAKAETTSALNTGAAAMQLSGNESFLTGVVAVGVNRIKDTTTAGVTYTDKQNATSMNVGNLDISATSRGDITSVAMGVSGTLKGTMAVGGSGSHNYIENNAASNIEKADINSAGNVGVVARSDEAITNYAGVIDVAAGGQGVSAAIGITGSNNKISGNTSALIDNSKVIAKGSNSNKIKANSGLKTDDTYLIDGAVTKNTWKSSKLQKGRKEEEKTGVVVDASATHAIASVMANGGVAVGENAGVSVAGVINLNDVEGSTTAKVLDSQLNTKDIRNDVNVHAADYTNVAEFSGAASVGIGEDAGVAAGFTGTTNDISRVTAAGVSTSAAVWDSTNKQYTIKDTSKTKNTIYAQDFNVVADAKQAMSAFNVTGAVAGSTKISFETGDNVNTNKMNSSTVALVTNTTADYTKNAKVEASHEDAIYNLNVDAGVSISADPYSVAGSLNVGVGVVNEDSTVTADVENSSLKKSDSSSSASLSIGSSNKTTLEAQLVSVGVAAGLVSAGVASSIAVNNIDTRVTSKIMGSELIADTLKIDTTDETKVKDATGTGAGGLEAGIGVGVDVTTFNDTVSTIVDKSTLKATNALTVNTKTQREIGSTVAGVGIGAAGISVNVLSVTVNDGIKSLGKSKDEDGKDTSFSHTDTINKVLKSVNDHNNQDYSENFHGMTDAEKKEMKEKVKTNAKSGDNVSGTGVHTYVQNSSTLEAINGALTVNNTELNDADLNGGSGSLGVAAVNVADTVYHLNQLNDIYVNDSTIKGGNVSLTTRQGNVTANNEDAIRLQTVQAGLGLAGIGVGYAGLTTQGNTGITIDHGTLEATNGDLTVKSTDAAQSKTNMIGVSAAGVAVPVSVAHNTNTANNYVTVKGGSALAAATNKTREVTDSEGKKKTEKVPAYINLQTDRSGRVAGKTVGVGVGGAAVVVNTAKVYDKSTSAVSVSGSNNSFTADAIKMEAVNAPVIKAEAGGTGVALLGVSVMQSNAEAYSAAKVDVPDNNKLLGDTVLAQAVVGKEGTDMTHAETHATSATLVGINPNKAKAITETTASVNMGKETYKTEKKEKTTDEQGQEKEITVTGSYTDLALITRNNASRRAIIGNTTIGLGVSIGAGDARAEGNDRSLVTAKGGGSDAVKLQNLKIDAGGSNTAKGFADGDSGGLLAVGASATITMKTKTTNTASLSGAWDVTGSADIASGQQVTSKGSSKTGAGGLLSVTWANSDNHVEMDTRTELKDGTQLNAGQSYVLAANKTVTGAYDGEYWNNHMNVGGLIQVAPDVKSEQEITDKANVVIGKNAKVTTARGQVYDAYSDIDMYNKVEGKAGGAFENIYVYSDNFVASANKITVDGGAELKQEGAFEDGNDITLSSSDKIKMDGAAEVYIGGLEGTVEAEVDNRVTRNNGVEVNGKLTSSHDIKLYAGSDADGADAELDVKSLAEAHNNTLLAFYTNPEVKLDLKNNQQVKVGAVGSATSVRNINLAADNGSETLKKDTAVVEWLFLSEDRSSKTTTNAPGKSDISETNNNFVNVEGALKAGTHNKVNIAITGSAVPEAGGIKPVSGQPALVIDTAGSSENFNKDEIKTGDMDYATQLGAQLAAVEALIKEYSTGTDSKSMASYLGYVQQRQRILDELDKRGLFDLEKGADGKTVKVYKTSGLTVRYVEIPEITASGGNITVQSENLYGKGKLEANGAPQVTVTNNSNAYLKLDGIQIKDPGGEIRFSGTGTALTSVAKNADVSSLNKDKAKQAAFTAFQNDTAGGKVSAITVTNENKAGASVAVKDSTGRQGTYTPITDVGVVGDLSNDSGDIRVTNSSGSITIGGTSKGANITGRTVQLTARDTISQDYVDGIVNIGGRPQDLNANEVKAAMAVANITSLNNKTVNTTASQTGLKQTASDMTDAELGRIAGDSVYIAAADINVNGLIQSGYSKYEASFANGDANHCMTADRAVTVQGRTMYKVNDGGKPVYDSSTGAFKYIVQVYYDPQTRRLLLEDIDTKGGQIYLTGRISSTGNGRILAADGGADISISNNCWAYDLDVGKVLNNNIEGKITITDLAKDTWTEYTRSATKTIENYSRYAKDSAAAEKAMKTAAGIGYNSGAAPSGVYKVKDGLRYNWTLGTETGTTKYYHRVQNSLFWGALDTTSSESKLKELESSTAATEVNDGGTRNLGSGTFIDVINDSEYGKKLNSTEFGAVYENRVTSSTRTVTGSWKEGGDWWALWSNPKYHLEWNTKTGSSQSYTFSLKADRDIGIGFIGKEDGSITLANNGIISNLRLTDTIQNNSANAALTLRVYSGGIVQQGDAALITGKADLQASKNIENIRITSLGTRTASGDGKTYTASDKVLLSAVSTQGGNIDVTVRGGTAEGQALPGNVEIQKLQSNGNASKGIGDVTLRAEGNITQAGTDAAVKGREITLTSVNGGIGMAKQAVVMDSHPEAYGMSPESSNVDAAAQKDIYLTEATGDMRIGSIVSAEGDVTLTAKSGRLLDALPQTESVNNVEEDDLVHHWIDAGLIAGTEDYEGAYIKGLKQDAANYKARVEEQFALFTAGEASAAVQEMFTKADGTVYSNVDEYLKADNNYQAIVDKYTNPTYAWTKDQLLYSIRNAIVNKESGVTAETQGKAANVQGKNVSLNAKGIGIHSGDTTTILASDLTGGSETAIANLKLLANTDAADVTIKDKKGNILTFGTDAQGKQTVTARDASGNKVETDGTIYSFVIGNLNPLGVKATGQVNVTADGEDVFIAGRSDAKDKFSPLNTGVINAEGQNVRLYTQEGIYNTLEEGNDDKANVIAKNLIAYGGTKDIGAAYKHLGIDLEGDLLSANADGSIFIRNMRSGRYDNLNVGSLYAGDTIALDSPAGIQMTQDKNYADAYLNAGTKVQLNANPKSGSIGSQSKPLRILNNGAEISLEADEAYIRGVNGQRGNTGTMKLGNVKTARNATLESEANLRLTGNLTAGSGTVLASLAGGSVSVSGSIDANNALLRVDPDKDGNGKGDIAVDGNISAGNLAVMENYTKEGNILITGNVTGGGLYITGKNGRILADGKLEAVNQDISIASETGNIDIGGDLDAKRDLTVKTGGDGVILLYEDEKVDEEMNIYAGRNISLKTENSDIVVEGKITSDTGDITAATIKGDIIFAGDVKAGGNVNATVKDGGSIIYSGTTLAGGEVKATTADGMIMYDSAVEAGGNVTAEAGTGWIWYDGNVKAGGNVTAAMGNGIIIYADSVSAGGNVEAKITENGLILYLGKVNAGRNVIADAASGDILYGSAVEAGRSVIARTGSGTVSYMGTVTAGKDLPEQIRKGYGKIAYYDRYGLVGYSNSFDVTPVRNAKPAEIKIGK